MGIGLSVIPRYATAQCPGDQNYWAGVQIPVWRYIIHTEVKHDLY